MTRCTTAERPSTDCTGKLSFVGMNFTGGGCIRADFAGTDCAGDDGPDAWSARDTGSGVTTAAPVGSAAGCAVPEAAPSTESSLADFGGSFINLSFLTVATRPGGAAWSASSMYRVRVCATGS